MKIMRKMENYLSEIRTFFALFCFILLSVMNVTNGVRIKIWKKNGKKRYFLRFSHKIKILKQNILFFCDKIYDLSIN